MSNPNSTRELKKYPYPANMYKMVYPEALGIDNERLDNILARLKFLPEGYKYIAYLYFYEKMPYFDIGLRIKASSTKARVAVLDVVKFLAGRKVTLGSIDLNEGVYYPPDFLKPSGIPEVSFLPKVKNVEKVTEKSIGVYSPPEREYTYLEKIGVPHDDYWTGSMNHSNRNMTNASEGRYDARMSSFEKREKIIVKMELDCVSTSDEKSEKEMFDGLMIKDCPYKVCKYWPSNLISRVFSSGYRMSITEDQYAALNKALLEIKENDPISLACLLLTYMYDQQYSMISSATGLQPYTIKKKVGEAIKYLSSSKCKGYLYYGLKGYKSRKSGAIEGSQQKNLLYCSTFSAGIVEQFAKTLKIHTMGELLDSSARDIVARGNFPNAALAEIYTVLYHAGHEFFHDGSPLSDLVSVGKVRYYRGKSNTEKAEVVAKTEEGA